MAKLDAKQLVERYLNEGQWPPKEILHDDLCAVHRGGECNCPSFVFIKGLECVGQNGLKNE